MGHDIRRGLPMIIAQVTVSVSWYVDGTSMATVSTYCCDEQQRYRTESPPAGWRRPRSRSEAVACVEQACRRLYLSARALPGEGRPAG
jgi:hypothetical protein